jgi:hypothetical protein
LRNEHSNEQSQFRQIATEAVFRNDSVVSCQRPILVWIRFTSVRVEITPKIQCGPRIGNGIGGSHEPDAGKSGDEDEKNSLTVLALSRRVEMTHDRKQKYSKKVGKHGTDEKRRIVMSASRTRRDPGTEIRRPILERRFGRWHWKECMALRTADISAGVLADFPST